MPTQIALVAKQDQHACFAIFAFVDLPRA